MHQESGPFEQARNVQGFVNFRVQGGRHPRPFWRRHPVLSALTSRATEMILNLFEPPQGKSRGIPASRSVAHCRGSYTPSTGVLRLYDSHSDELSNTFFSQILSSVEIPAVLAVALRAYPLAIGETEVFILVSAVGAQLG